MRYQNKHGHAYVSSYPYVLYNLALRPAPNAVPMSMPVPVHLAPCLLQPNLCICFCLRIFLNGLSNPNLLDLLDGDSLGSVSLFSFAIHGSLPHLIQVHATLQDAMLQRLLFLAEGPALLEVRFLPLQFPQMRTSSNASHMHKISRVHTHCEVTVCRLAATSTPRMTTFRGRSLLSG